VIDNSRIISAVMFGTGLLIVRILVITAVILVIVSRSSTLVFVSVIIMSAHQATDESLTPCTEKGVLQRKHRSSCYGLFDDWKTIIQAMMELGATVCMPQNPCCPDCPVSHSCQAHAAVKDFESSGGSSQADAAPRVTDYPIKVREFDAPHIK
jgi:hypothetical protein